jgi:hypothetical protein
LQLLDTSGFAVVAHFLLSSQLPPSLMNPKLFSIIYEIYHIYHIYNIQNISSQLPHSLTILYIIYIIYVYIYIYIYIYIYVCIYIILCKIWPHTLVIYTDIYILY